MNQKQFLEHIENTFATGLELVKRKNEDYAVEVNPFQNFDFAKLIGLKPEQAILVRVSDKLARVSNLLRKDDVSVVEESIQDTCLDMLNYLAILMAYMENEKTKTSIL